MRLSHAEFKRRPLRVHAVLADVQLYDVWRIELEGGGAGRHLADILALIDKGDAQQIPPAVRGLFWLRRWLGRLFGWERGEAQAHAPAQSYLHRLPDDLRAASLDEAGSLRGPTRILYRLEDEVLAEVINATVQAFICFSIAPRESGYVADLAVYVINSKWWTRYYLAAIEPFRRWVVYPGLVRALQAAWREAYAGEK